MLLSQHSLSSVGPVAPPHSPALCGVGVSLLTAALCLCVAAQKQARCRLRQPCHPASLTASRSVHALSSVYA